MQEEFDLIENRQRPSPSTTAGWPALLVAALVVGGLTLTILYLLLAGQRAGTVATYKVGGDAGRAFVEYHGTDGDDVAQWVTLPWERTLSYQQLQTELTLRVVEIADGPGPVRCEIRLDGELAATAETAAEGEVECQIVIK